MSPFNGLQGTIESTTKEYLTVGKVGGEIDASFRAVATGFEKEKVLGEAYAIRFKEEDAPHLESWDFVCPMPAVYLKVVETVKSQ